jgi:hypothetical protein
MSLVVASVSLKPAPVAIPFTKCERPGCWRHLLGVEDYTPSTRGRSIIGRRYPKPRIDVSLIKHPRPNRHHLPLPQKGGDTWHHFSRQTHVSPK